jgi:hypothetical protein
MGIVRRWTSLHPTASRKATAHGEMHNTMVQVGAAKATRCPRGFAQSRAAWCSESAAELPRDRKVNREPSE